MDRPRISRRSLLNAAVLGGGAAAAAGVLAGSHASAAVVPDAASSSEFAALPPALTAVADKVTAGLKAKGLGRLGDAFTKYFADSWLHCMSRYRDGIFVITGDIQAMWLRDSSASVRPYLAAAHDAKVYDVISGVLRQQVAYVLTDPYANAFRRETDPTSSWATKDVPKPTGNVFERKYEVDSLAGPLTLGYALWKASGRLDHADDKFFWAAGNIIGLWWRETRHETASPYTFRRGDSKWELQRDGKGSKTAYTGMTWSGFRPSDDPCSYGYLVPSNALAAVALEGLARMAEASSRHDMAVNARNLGAEIRRGIAAHGRMQPPPDNRQSGPVSSNQGAEKTLIYAYEVSGPLSGADGGARAQYGDDANIPSLLALPYLGFCPVSDPTYTNTRARLLSSDTNQYYFKGKYAAGIGSGHTPKNYVWPLALTMQALTSTSDAERRSLATTVLDTDRTALLHESFDVNDPTKYTRYFFNWPNALYSELLMELAGTPVRQWYPSLVG